MIEREVMQRLLSVLPAECLSLVSVPQREAAVTRITFEVGDLDVALLFPGVSSVLSVEMYMLYMLSCVCFPFIFSAEAFSPVMWALKQCIYSHVCVT